MKIRVKELSHACSAFTLACALLVGIQQTATANNRTVFDIIEPGTTYKGFSYNRLAGSWWNWVLKEPEPNNVLLDDTGADCTRNQKGDVWFLAGAFFGTTPITRSCTIPTGKALFFPIANTLSVYPEFPEPTNRCTLSGRYDLNRLSGQLGGVRCDARDDLIVDAISNDAIVDRMIPMEVTIDDLATSVSPDRKITDLFGYRAQSQPGGYVQRFPENNIFGVPAGNRFPSVTEGYWIFLKPLKAGKYRIHYHTDNVDGSFIDITFNLTISGS